MRPEIASMVRLLALVTAGCALGGAAPTGEARAGNAELGIAEFQVLETATRTSVIGLDAAGSEVARLDLVHGRFELTGIFRDDHDAPVVDGRKLDVSIHGEKQMFWETKGFGPVLHLPAHP